MEISPRGGEGNADLNILAEVIRQPCEVVRPLLERANLRRAVALHKGLCRRAYVSHVFARVHGGHARWNHARAGVAADEIALGLRASGGCEWRERRVRRGNRVQA